MAETLGEYMLRQRRRTSFSQTEAAAIARCSRSTFSGWENDKGAPTVPQLRALLDWYGVPDEDRKGLLGGPA